MSLLVGKNTVGNTIIVTKSSVGPYTMILEEELRKEKVYPYPE